MQMLFVIVFVLRGFGGSKALKSLSMNKQLYMIRPKLVDLNLDKPHYYPFIISMNKCDGSYITARDPLVTICEYVI